MINRAKDAGVRVAQQGYIKTRVSPWRVLVIFVTKKDGMLTLSGDCKKMNKVSIKKKHPFLILVTCLIR